MLHWLYMPEFFSESSKDALSFFHTDPTKGLSSSDIEKKQEKYGKNVFPNVGF